MSGADNNRRTNNMARTIRTKVFKFNELSEEAKEKAIESLSDINVDFDWWDHVYEDAEAIGLKIMGFDLYRGTIEGEFKGDADQTAHKIILSHGETCDTHKTAKRFLETVKQIEATTQVVFNEGLEDEYEDYSEREQLIEEAEEEYLKSLLEDYRIVLQNEYDYQTSREAIIETIEANEYEFTKDGKQF